MGAFLERYGIAIFVLVIIGIMVLMASGVGATIENLVEKEVKQFTQMTNEETKNSFEKEKAHKVNEYGFYYNRGYVANVEAFNDTIVLFLKEDKTVDMIFTQQIGNALSTSIYEPVENKLILTTGMGNLEATVSNDGLSINCPALNATFVVDDNFAVEKGDYYYFMDDFEGGYRALVKDKTKSEYGEICSTINNKPVRSLSGTFCDCTNLTTAPIIPETITNMGDCFGNCTSLETAPIIPESVQGLIGAFSGCTNLKKAPVIPCNVIDLSSTFNKCINLTGNIEVNTNKIDINSPNSYCGAFSDTVKNIKITGSCSDEIKEILASTAESGNVTY